MSFLGSETEEDFIFACVAPETLNKIVGKLKTKNSSGNDNNISTKLLNSAIINQSTFLYVQSITSNWPVCPHIFCCHNFSGTSASKMRQCDMLLHCAGYVPTQFKTAKAVSIFSQGTNTILQITGQ